MYLLAARGWSAVDAFSILATWSNVLRGCTDGDGQVRYGFTCFHLRKSSARTNKVSTNRLEFCVSCMHIAQMGFGMRDFNYRIVSTVHSL